MFSVDTYVLAWTVIQVLPQEVIALAEADARLASRFVMPAATRVELASQDASALRARHAALAREEAKHAAVDAGWDAGMVQRAGYSGCRTGDRLQRLGEDYPPHDAAAAATCRQV
jgi:hypothetical protein